MRVTIEIRTVYGRETAYPVCDHAKFLAAMAGTTTLTEEKLRLIMAQPEYEVIVVPVPGRLAGFVGR